AQYGKARRVWLMDRGVPTEEVLAETRAADPPVHYLVGTPKGRLTRLEKHLVARPWQEARPGVQVKLLAQEGELYVLAESRDLDGARIEKPSVHSGAHELLDLHSRNPQSGGGLGPIFCEQGAGDIVAIARAHFYRMARRHPVAVTIKQHPGEEARLARLSATSVPGGIAGELLLNGIP